MSEHTKGPWWPGCFVKKGGPDACHCRSILSGGWAGEIAQIGLWNGIQLIQDGNNDCPPLDEAIANAHLIASAPELLEACEAAWPMLELACRCEDGTIGSGLCAACCAVKLARAAIAKAKLRQI